MHSIRRGPLTAIREAVGVLHADDVGDLDRPLQVGEADVADPHTGDQALVASRDQRAKLIDESRVWDGVFDEPQVHRGELLDAQRGEIFLDAGAQLVGVVARASMWPDSSRRAPTLLTSASPSG